ncbi:hypothetical protein [Streptomyces sp. NBC_01750]|uniref:hypothetical protein n=1 Tax=Streptomyces sp. NBC_01750 TaxID=2975928 RepID=UPI002DD7F8D1|nr:hypothetical protein [Streptomyces sp. NBC_01750]WSD38059.1 hypothetical protein OG966_01895 [Streptomyces sp. NBC_01750]
MLDDVLVEDRDVAIGGLDVEMSEQRGADMDGQAAATEGYDVHSGMFRALRCS